MVEPIKPRRWFRFSLRMLLVVITVLCVWLGFTVNAARRQKAALTAIQCVGGQFAFDYQHLTPRGRIDEAAFDPKATAPGPAWLREWIGDDYFRTPLAVYFENALLTESDLAQLANLPKLRLVDIRNTKIVPEGSVNRAATGPAKSVNVDPFAANPIDAGQQQPLQAANARPIRDNDLAVLAELKDLRQFSIIDADISGAGLQYLVNLTHLESLCLANSNVQDEGMEFIGKLASLEELARCGARISDGAMRPLQNLMKLKYLNLVDVNITDAALEYLNANQLNLLWLQNTQIGDRSLERIGKITALDTLYLDGTRVTNEGLRYLQNLSNLKMLTLERTLVDDAGLNHLAGLKQLEGVVLPAQVSRGAIRGLKQLLPTTNVSGP